MNNRIIAIFFLLVLLGLNGCPRKRAKQLPGKPLEEKEAGTIKKSEEKIEVRYRYAGEKWRDPFTPPEETGEGFGIRKTGKRGVQIELSRLKLTGIMTSSSTRERYALIEAGSGRGYVVKGGKLIDNYNNVVEGVAAIVRKDKVILITSDNVIQELILKIE